MFLRRITIKKDGKAHAYWALIESVRTIRGPRQRTVAYLGELGAAEQAGWAEVRRLLDRQPVPEASLFATPVAADEPIPEHITVHVRGVRVERTRDFGEVYLGLLLWRALHLDALLEAAILPGREDVPGAVVGAILALARFCEPGSELHIAESWYRRTGLPELLGVPVDVVNKDRLYRGLDAMLPHKATIRRHLRERFATLFDATYDLILYDVTSTYFEGRAEQNPQTQRGYSRDKRFDCKQVCIAVVVTRDGPPLGYEVFAGNRNDVTTLEDIVEAMERTHGRIGRVWVVDRGIASEENLAFLRERGATYVVGTPKSQLPRFERHLLEAGWTEVEPGVEVKNCPGPDGTETFVLCRSQERRAKEQAIHARFARRIEAGLTKLARRVAAQRRPDRAKIERQIGRLLGDNARAAGLFDVQVTEAEGGGRRVSWIHRPEWQAWASLSQG